MINCVRSNKSQLCYWIHEILTFQDEIANIKLAFVCIMAPKQ